MEEREGIRDFVGGSGPPPIFSAKPCNSSNLSLRCPKTPSGEEVLLLDRLARLQLMGWHTKNAA